MQESEANFIAKNNNNKNGSLEEDVKVCPFSGKVKKQEGKPRTLIQWGEHTTYTDVLHKKTILKTNCTESSCSGSLMNIGANNSKLEDEVAESQMNQFLDFYYDDPANHETPAKSKEDRLAEIRGEIERKGTYRQTFDEMEWGAKTAWRNAARCSGRIVWKTLKMFDCRHVTAAPEMFDCIMRHFDYSFNGGNIRPAITVFRERQEGKIDLRVWNGQVLIYAGYKQEDGSIIGDPMNVE